MKPVKIFIAATRQDDGKTTISLGLIHCLKKRFKKVGFIKPIGQRYLVEKGWKVDEDSVFIEKVCRMKCNIKDMNPIAIEHGFTEKFIKSGNRQGLIDMMLAAYDRIASKNDVVVIEGTGHAGVGSVFDLSNAKVAGILDAKVIIVAPGGIGRSIDEIVLNLALFEKEGIEVLGVVVNKVLASKYKKIKRIVKLGLEKKGIELLGVVPYIPFLSMPLIEHLVEETDFELITGKVGLLNRINNILICAMTPEDAINYIKDNSLLIIPGDREDILRVLLNNSSRGILRQKRDVFIAGIVLTGGILPRKKIISLMKKKKIPVFLSYDHTYATASRIHDITVKIRPEDKEKIDVATALVERYVNIDRILTKLYSS